MRHPKTVVRLVLAFLLMAALGVALTACEDAGKRTPPPAVDEKPGQNSEPNDQERPPDGEKPDPAPPPSTPPPSPGSSALGDSPIISGSLDFLAGTELARYVTGVTAATGDMFGFVDVATGTIDDAYNFSIQLPSSSEMENRLLHLADDLAAECSDLRGVTVTPADARYNGLALRLSFTPEFEGIGAAWFPLMQGIYEGSEQKAYVQYTYVPERTTIKGTGIQHCWGTDPDENGAGEPNADDPPETSAGREADADIELHPGWNTVVWRHLEDRDVVRNEHPGSDFTWESPLIQ